MSRRFWAISIFVVTTLLYAAGPLLLLLADRSWGTSEFLLPAFYAFSLVGILIATRRPDNTVAWICLASGLALGLESALWGVYYFGLANPEVVALPVMWAVAGSVFPIPGLFLVTTLLLLVFPNGRLPSPRWRWFARVTAGLIVANLIVGFFLPAAGDWVRPEVSNPIVVEGGEDLDLLVLPLFVCVLVSVVALVRRFRRSTGIERLQLRWLATAGGTAVAIWAVAILVVADALGGDAAVATTSLGLLLIPVAIGVAVLRYRLFDIDRLISRTVTYALMAGFLAGMFAGIVIGLPRLLGLPEESPLLVAAATLAAAALFNPLRRRVQVRVDRRFNRARYDAQREVEEFAERLRDELDLDDLANETLQVVTNTVQPTAASLWIRTDR